MSKKEINSKVPEWVEKQDKEPKENWHNKNKEKVENDQEYIEDNRPDEVADGIIEKINSVDFEEHEIQPVIEDIRRGDTASAAGKLGELIKIDLTSKEKKHFIELPLEIVLGWFKEYIKESEKEGIVKEEVD